MTRKDEHKKCTVELQDEEGNFVKVNFWRDKVQCTDTLGKIFTTFP